MKPNFDDVEHEQVERFYHHDQKANSTARSSTDAILMKVELFSSGYATWSEEPELFVSGYATWSGEPKQFERFYHHDQKANSTARSSTDAILNADDRNKVKNSCNCVRNNYLT